MQPSQLQPGIAATAATTAAATAATAAAAAAPPPDACTPNEKRTRILPLVPASSGNLVEWFDFPVHVFCAIYLAPAFFPKSNQTVQLLTTAGAFAAGFLMRSIGRRWQAC